jgi:hypothetical protein
MPELILAALVIAAFLVSLWAQRGMWYDAEHDMWFEGDMEADLKWRRMWEQEQAHANGEAV